MAILAGVQGCATPGHNDVPKNHYVFSYFTGQDDGAKLAISTNGRNWKVLNNGAPVIRPAKDDILRDPSIHQGPDGIYRMVWTTGWTGREIGLSTSPDLVHWSDIKKIPVMANFPHTGHTWAPEIFYDKAAKSYIVYWSSDNDLWNIYYTTTKDFISFSETKILFSNGGRGGGKAGATGPIDAYIFEKTDNEYVLYYKKDDNTGVPNLYWRTGPSPLGPWGAEDGPVTPSTGDEGPSVIRLGDQYAMYTDPFESDLAYMYTSKDLKHWRREATDLKMSHGTALEIDERTWRMLDHLP